MEEVLPFRCVNQTTYSAKKKKKNKTQKQIKTNTKTEKNNDNRACETCQSALTSVLACKQIGRLDMQSMYVRKSKREREGNSL